MNLRAIIEIPANTNYKYEIDKETDILVLDRVLDINIPFNYGYVPTTLSEDGDPIDIFVISRGQLFPKTLVKVTLFGAFKCKDGGKEDHKLIAYLQGEEDLEKEKLPVIAHIHNYLTNYKPGFEVLEYVELEEAEAILDESFKNHDALRWIPGETL